MTCDNCQSSNLSPSEKNTFKRDGRVYQEQILLCKDCGQSTRFEEFVSELEDEEQDFLEALAADDLNT